MKYIQKTNFNVGSLLTEIEGARRHAGQSVAHDALFDLLIHLFHHPAHLLVLFDDAVDILNRGA